MGNYKSEYTGSHLLAIGINDYADPSFCPLGDAENDANMLAQVLADEPYHFTVKKLLGEEATKAAIVKALADLRITQSDDRIIFYFAGHGYTLTDTVGNEVGYLACSDTNPGNPYAGLEFEEVTKIRRWAKAKHIAFILDACFSGKALGLTRAGVPQATAEEYMQRRSWQVLTAGGDEVVSDAQSMTGVLVQALREGIPGDSGPLTLSHVGQHVRDTVAARRKRLQIPVCQYLEGSSNGEMVLYIPPEARPIDLLPQRLRWALTSENVEVRYVAIAEAERLLTNPQLTDIVRQVLDELSVNDDDREVRRRAKEALRTPVAPPPTPPLDATTTQTPPLELEEVPPPAQQPKTLGAKPTSAASKARPKPAQPRPMQKQRRNWIPFAIGGGVIAVVLVIGLLVLSGVFGGGPEKTPEPTQWVAGSAPATTPPLPPTLTAGGEQARAAKTYADMTMCYPQLGAESDWRTANTASFKETAEKLGFKLIFSDAQQNQENQISAMRACIQQGVSVIALPPIVEDGWDAVLTEAKNASIPVIIVDRRVSADPSLYATHIGSDMVLEGERAAAEFNKRFPNGGAILEISGMTGSGAEAGRTEGFRNKLNANIRILDSQTGNFTRAEAFPVMQAFLKKYKAGTDFQGIFIHNDDMGLGAIEALKGAGVKPGDLFIVSVDGTHDGLQAVIDGWFQADVECNPMLGPQVAEMALKVINGETVDREIPTNETVYYPDTAKDEINNRKY